MNVAEPPAAIVSPTRSRSRWITGSLVAAAVLAGVGGLWLLFEDHLVASALSRYRAPQWREALLQTRLEHYGWFFLAASAALVAFAAALRGLVPAPDRPRTRGGQPNPASRAVTLLASAAIVAVMYGFSTAEWDRFDRPCWDGYCDYADLFRDVLYTGDASAPGRLLRFMHTDYHSNSPAGPTLTALVSGATGMRTVSAYRVVVGAASLGAIVLVWLVLLPQAGVGTAARMGALVLVGSNMVLIRSAFFPQTDALVLFWTTALLAVGWLRWKQPRAWHGPACFTLLATGTFVKLSFLPALALLPVWAAFVRYFPRIGADSESTPNVAWDGIVYAMLPAGGYFGFQYWIDTSERFSHELSRTSTEDTLLVFVVMSLLHAGLFSGLLIAVARKRLAPFDFFLLGWVGLYLLSLWGIGASGWDRFYLPIVPALAVIAARGLDEIGDSFGTGVMWSAVVLIAGLNYAALGLGLYY